MNEIMSDLFLVLSDIKTIIANLDSLPKDPAIKSRLLYLADAIVQYVEALPVKEA